MATAEITLNEVCDMKAFEQGSETVLKDNIKAGDAAFRDNVGTLYNTYTAVDMENTAEYAHYIKDLRLALYNVEGKYSVMAPTVVGNDCNFYWYKIVSDVTGLAMGVNSAGRVALVDNADDATDDILWAVVPAEDGTLRLLNASTETYMRRYAIGTRPQNNYSVKSNVDDVPVSFEFDGSTTNIFTGDGSTAIDTGTSSFVSYNTKGVTSGWHFELVSIEQNEELHKNLTSIDGIVAEGAVAGGEAMYDLYGRKIQAPVKNSIYIKGNQKVIAE